ncbi:MAG: DUF3037 domain-containing protein [Chloroflexota bacterium]
MSAKRRNPFQYAVVRVVPRVERGELVNAGVILFCRPKRFLAARVRLDERKLHALAPDVPADELKSHLGAIERIASGDPEAGPIARLAAPERFHWLVAPSSTMIQPSEVHTGLCEDPSSELDLLFEELVG